MVPKARVCKEYLSQETIYWFLEGFYPLAKLSQLSLARVSIILGQQASRGVSIRMRFLNLVGFLFITVRLLVPVVNA